MSFLNLVRPRPAFAGFRLPSEVIVIVIVVAVRRHLPYCLSYRDVKELLVERGVEVDHVTVFRWVQRFTPLPADGGQGGDRPVRSPPDATAACLVRMTDAALALLSRVYAPNHGHLDADGRYAHHVPTTFTATGRESLAARGLAPNTYRTLTHGEAVARLPALAAVAGERAAAWHLTAQHRQLMAQYRDLDSVRVRCRPKAEHADDPSDDHQRHRTDHHERHPASPA